MSQPQNVPTELGTRSVGQLLRMYVIPAIIAMTASSLYNMVDSIFIGHIPETGPLAISGLAVTFPLMNLSTALGTLVAGVLDAVQRQVKPLRGLERGGRRLTDDRQYRRRGGEHG